MMKILAIADEEYPGFYEYYTPGVFSEYDLILACGDLKKCYLEFINNQKLCKGRNKVLKHQLLALLIYYNKN